MTLLTCPYCKTLLKFSEAGVVEMIAFHGTNELAARKIAVEGFLPGTYFAYEKQWAVKFGGPYVFAVEFSDDPGMWHGFIDEEDWQFHTNIHIPATMIRGMFF